MMGFGGSVFFFVLAHLFNVHFGQMLLGPPHRLRFERTVLDRRVSYNLTRRTDGRWHLSTDAKRETPSGRVALDCDDW